MTNIITYTLTATNDDIHFWKNSIERAIGQSLTIDKNRLVIPISLGEGNIDFYEMEEGIALRIIDCCFHEDFLFKRKVVKEKMHYCAFLNFSDQGVVFNASTYTRDTLPPIRWSLTVSSSDGDFEILVPAKIRFKMVVINCAEVWLHQKLAINPNDFKKIVTFSTLQRQFLNTCMPAVKKAVRESIAKVLADTTISINKLALNEDTQRIYNFAEMLTANLDIALPSVAYASKECLMSESKFTRLFKKIFSTSYADYFWSQRLEQSCKFLKKGLSVKDVSILCGYKNISGFSKAFKEKYKCSPLQYQKSAI